MASLGGIEASPLPESTARIAEVIRSLPVEDATLSLGGRERTFRGASLGAYGRTAGLLDGTEAQRDGYFMVTASDGARASVALAEARPEISTRPILLAIEQDGLLLRVGVRLVVPREGTRSLLGVTGVSFHATAPGASRPADGAIAVSGELPRPGRYEVSTRAPERSVEVSRDAAGVEEWSGTRLSDVLAEAGMFFMTDGETLAAQVVVVTGADGSHTVLAASEVGPEYAHAPVLLATHRNGERLAGEAVRLVVPFDRTEARTIDSVVSVELRTG